MIALTVEASAALARLEGALDVGLSDVQRGTVPIAPALNWTRAELLRVQVPMVLDPAHRTLVANKDLVGPELDVACDAQTHTHTRGKADSGV